MTTKRLLIVDDEVQFGVLVKRIAEKLKFSVEVTTSGQDFKDAYKRFDPTVIILDLIMPEIDGIELIAWLASVGCVARIIIVSGYTPIYSKMGTALGEAKGLLSISRLSKPVSVETLTAALQ